MNTLRSMAALALAAAALTAPVHADEWPAKPVKVIVAFTAGGTTDILARMVSVRLAEKFKQPFVIENKPGAGGNIGTAQLVRAPADGYTISVSSVGPIAVNPTLFKKLGYNPVTDLAAVGNIAEVPNVLVVHPSTGIHTMQEFLRYAKANPGKLNYASTGVGTSSHLSGFMLSSIVGFDAQHVPYKGAEALTDMIAGRVQFMFATIPSVIQQIRAGKLTAVAVSSAKRSRSMPEVPTVAESGFPGFSAGSWFGFFAPKGTPREVVLALNHAINEIVAERAIDAKLIDEGADPAAGTPEKFQEFVKSEYEKWRTVVIQSGASID